MTTPNRAAVLLYSTRIPIDGWAGLPLVGIAAALSAVLPEAGRMLMAGVIGGLLLGSFLIALRRSR